MMQGEGRFASVPVPRGRFYGPCAGQDLPLAFEVFGDVVDHFTFCDLAYSGSRVSARRAVPAEWRLMSRVQGLEEASVEKATWYPGNRPFRPRVTIETWRRPDGSEALVELRRDLAEDVLVDHFAPGSIAAFMHVNDGTGEGGSDLWFLASPKQGGGEDGRKREFLPETVSRLCSGGIVVTDGALADPGFRFDTSFDLAGRRWELVTQISNERRADRPLTAWRNIDPSIV
jgi:hypothetical protein